MWNLQIKLIELVCHFLLFSSQVGLVRVCLLLIRLSCSEWPYLRFNFLVPVFGNLYRVTRQSFSLSVFFSTFLSVHFLSFVLDLFALLPIVGLTFRAVGRVVVICKRLKGRRLAG